MVTEVVVILAGAVTALLTDVQPGGAHRHPHHVVVAVVDVLLRRLVEVVLNDAAGGVVPATDAAHVCRRG